MLDLDHEEAREARGRPVAVELVGQLLLGPVVAVEPEPLRVLAGQARVGGLLAEGVEGVGEVAVEDGERVERLGVLVEAVGQEHHGAEVHRAAPELREPLALDPHVPDVRVSFGGGMGGIAWSRSIRTTSSLEGSIAISRGRAQQVAGRPAPLLSLPAVHRQLHHVAVPTAEGLVPVEEGLDVVAAGLHVARGPRPGSRGRPRRRRPPPRLPALDVDAEDLLAPRRVRLAAPGSAAPSRGRSREQQQPPVDRLRGERGREAHGEAQARLASAPACGGGAEPSRARTAQPAASRLWVIVSSRGPGASI